MVKYGIIGNVEFDYNPLPKSPIEYVRFVEKELEFVKKRNERIKQYISNC